MFVAFATSRLGHLLFLALLGWLLLRLLLLAIVELVLLQVALIVLLLRLCLLPRVRVDPLRDQVGPALLLAHLVCVVHLLLELVLARLLGLRLFGVTGRGSGPVDLSLVSARHPQVRSSLFFLL